MVCGVWSWIDTYGVCVCVELDRYIWCVCVWSWIDTYGVWCVELDRYIWCVVCGVG